MAIALRYAARSDVGLVRQNNQDSAYAGPHLLVVADGMGGHAGGDVASSLAIGELAPLDGESHGADDALEHLKQAVFAAHRELLTRVDEEPQLTGMGTTVTALLRAGGKLALAHIGDSRAYVLRDGELIQITKDHTFVQTLVDEGRLTLEEAEQHPQRSVLMRVLSDVIDDVEPDLSMREGRSGDRYLLCSDGLSGVVSHDTLRDTLAAGSDPAAACEALVQLALRAGAPDNVTCIVADVVDAAATPPESNPAVVGAASRVQRGRMAAGAPSAAERAAALTAPLPALDGDTRPIPLVVTEDDEIAAPVRARRRAAVRSVAGLAALALVAAGGVTAWRWVMHQYFVGSDAGYVAIYKGLPEDVGPVSLSRVSTVVRDIPLTDLPSYDQAKVRSGIVADTEAQAWTIVGSLGERAEACREATASPLVSPTGTASPNPFGTTSTGPATGATGTTAPGAGAAAGTATTPAATGSTRAATTAPSATRTLTTAPSRTAAGATRTAGATTSGVPSPSLTETDPVTTTTAAPTPSATITGAPAGTDCGGATP